MSDELVLLPNVVAMTTAFLRAQDEVQELVGDEVVSALGKGQTYPAVRVTQFTDAPTIPRPLWHVRSELQIDAWGGPKALAWKIAETCRAVLVARFEGSHSYNVGETDIDGVVTGVRVGGLRDFPDETFTPARPRYLFTASVFAHPAK